MFPYALFLMTANAEEPTFVGTATGDAVEAPVTTLSAGLGGNFTAGNAESVAINAGLDGSRKWGASQLGLVGVAAVGFGAVDADANGFLSASERCFGDSKTKCSSTAQRYALDARYDWFASENASIYVLVGALHDKFAGYDLRTHAQLGYARHIIHTDITSLKIEAGVDFANENYVDGATPASTRLLAAQVALAYTHTFNENVSFKDSLTFYEPILTQPDGEPFAPYFTDVRLANVATINAKISDKLSISVSDTLGWRNEPVAPPDGITESRSNLDNTLSIALVASIL